MESADRAAPDGSSPPWGEAVLVEFDEGIAWVTLNRPGKRNAMNPRLNEEMLAVLDALEGDERCRVLVLTGAGDSWSAGMDLKEYFRDVDASGDPALQNRVRRTAAEWQWRRLSTYPKPTVAMVNGWCFGGAFTPLVACDLAVAAQDAGFGLSEINWGIPPGSVVSRALASVVPRRDALYHIMTGETFDGRAAERMRLVNEAVPGERLRERTRELALHLAGMNPVVLRAAKTGYKFAAEMPWDQAEDYLYAKLEQSQFLDPEQGRSQGMEQFLDAKSFRPGLGHYTRG
ncbi:p-hydroxycinnamoyl CoA hydratase/lyase [Streptomonospora algeriensis]|uniref:p-hydroxycinnamoyl CoA hydratase/lyase n=1 Tax=Streptomonospora algeriensis TaxID=995084 RepID=A0ABW3BEB9_9ACTN